MGIFDKEYLRQAHLDGFDKYKYSAVDTSPLSKYVMHPFWDKVVELYCPLWVAPNLLTFVGFLLTASNWLILCYYDYFYLASTTYGNHIPSWVWLLCAINHFLAHTLDGIDGKQARRTKSSTPLGELFDHGLDSWTSFFIPAVLYSVFGRLEHSYTPLRFYITLITVLFVFLLSHWEKYNTGILWLPWNYDFSQLSILLILMTTFFFGHESWKLPLPGGIHAVAVVELMVWGSGLFSLFMSLYNIYKSYRDGTGKNRTIFEGSLPLVSPFAFFTLTSIWVLYSPTNIFERDPRCFTFMVGIVFSNICCRLIVAQMSNTRCDFVSWLIVPVAIFVAAALALPTHLGLELPLLYLLTAFTFFAHVHYGVSVVRQLCRHLNIHCFRIKPFHSD